MSDDSSVVFLSEHEDEVDQKEEEEEDEDEEDEASVIVDAEDQKGITNKNVSIGQVFFSIGNRKFLWFSRYGHNSAGEICRHGDYDHDPNKRAGEGRQMYANSR